MKIQNRTEPGSALVSVLTMETTSQTQAPVPFLLEWFGIFMDSRSRRVDLSKLARSLPGRDRPALTAHDVARYFLATQDEDAGDLISNLKLQKLIYYAQGFHLAFFGKPLFRDRIKAWQHGPVVPDVWHAYRGAAWGAIEKPADFNIGRYDADTRELLDEVNQVYGQFSAPKLRDLTHEEPPWREAWERVQAGSNDDEVKPDSMRTYFESLIERP